MFSDIEIHGLFFTKKRVYAHKNMIRIELQNLIKNINTEANNSRSLFKIKRLGIYFIKSNIQN